MGFVEASKINSRPTSAKLDNLGSVRGGEIERSPNPGGLLPKTARYLP